jgi:hypothetical protein
MWSSGCEVGSFRGTRLAASKLAYCVPARSRTESIARIGIELKRSRAAQILDGVTERIRDLPNPEAYATLTESSQIVALVVVSKINPGKRIIAAIPAPR